MLSEQFNLYYVETRRLIESFVFKFDIQNELTNSQLRKLGHHVSEDPATWKYNLNLNGQYHAVDFPMEVLSSDTQVQIPFTKAVLATHPRTLLRHAVGGEDYYELRGQFPNQDTLIRGITKPVEMSTVLNAIDFQIIDFNRSLVGTNETTLMARVQKWIWLHRERHWNSDFAGSDPLYPAAFIGQMVQLLFGVIMQIRAELAHTTEAASYELWSFLGGHFELDKYKSHLTLTQALWLYRNIVDIRKHAGMARKLESMIANLATPNGLKLFQLDFLQSDVAFLDTLKRQAIYSFSDYGSEKVELASGSLIDETEVHNVTVERAAYNARTFETDVANAKTKGVSLVDNKLPTKILKASEDGSVLSQSVSNLAMKVNYWAYMAHLGLYVGDFEIPIPDAGSIFLNAKDAFTLYAFAVNRSIGKTLTDIPTVTAKSVVPVTYPTVNDIKVLNWRAEITDAFLTDFMSGLVELREVNDREAFTIFIEDILNQELLLDLKEQTFHHPESRSVLRDVSNALIVDVEVPLGDGSSTYSDWLYARGIDILELSAADWWELANNILTAVVDFADDTDSVGARQKAIIEILDALTSYDVMILGGEGSARSRDINSPSMLVYDVVVNVPIEENIALGERVLDWSTPLVSQSAELDLDYGLAILPPARETEDILVEQGEELHIIGTESAPFFIDAPFGHVLL